MSAKLRYKFILVFSWITMMNTNANTLDRISHQACENDQRLNKKYCLELFEIRALKPSAIGTVLLLPGLFQNANVYDLAPEEDISLARYISEKYNLRVFILNYRMIGNSEYISRSGLEDFAMDDIPNAIKYVSKYVNEKIYVIGHSQGAITLNLSLSGIYYKDNHYEFSSKVSKERQKYTKAIGLLAGNNKLHFEDKSNPLHSISKIIYNGRGVLSFFDKVNIQVVSHLFQAFSFVKLWDVLTIDPSISSETKRKLLTRTMEASTSKALTTFTKGVVNKNLQTNEGVDFNLNSKNIFIPVYHQTYSHDPFSPPMETKRDTFNFIGSQNKVFEIVENQSHEDLFLSRELHETIDPLIQFLIQQ